MTYEAHKEIGGELSQLLQCPVYINVEIVQGSSYTDESTGDSQNRGIGESQPCYIDGDELINVGIDDRFDLITYVRDLLQPYEPFRVNDRRYGLDFIATIVVFKVKAFHLKEYYMNSIINKLAENSNVTEIVEVHHDKRFVLEREYGRDLQKEFYPFFNRMLLPQDLYFAIDFKGRYDIGKCTERDCATRNHKICNYG